MKTESINRLAALIRKTFQCECDYVESMNVSETYKGRSLWAGDVGIFRLKGGKELGACYGWEADSFMDDVEPVIVPRTPDVDSPAAAVRAYILGLCGGSAEMEAVGRAGNAG